MAPERLAAPFGSLADLIGDHARARPAHVALAHGERSLDYAGLDAAMDRVAAALQREGIEPREAVTIIATSSIEYLVVFLGCLRAGVAAAVIQPSLQPATIARMAADSGARRAFVDSATLKAFDEAGIALANPVMLDGAPLLEQMLGACRAQPSAVAIQPHLPFHI